MTTFDDIATADDLRRLLDVALWAASNGRSADAATITGAVQAMRPEAEEPALVSAYVDLSRSRPAAAAKTLEGVVAQPSSSDVAKAMLAVARSRQGLVHEARRWAEEAARSSDPFAASVAAEFHRRGPNL
jgi:Tfp pilus assembly protein PilF